MRGKGFVTREYNVTVRRAFRSEWQTPFRDFGLK
jgi:hypothetical protein